MKKETWFRLGVFAIGFSPIASLSLSTFDLLPLHVSGPLVVLPAALGLLALFLAAPGYRRIIAGGLLTGIVAVTIYDVTCRFPFMALGLWPDFIPKIGRYLLQRDDVNWSVGYLWRYLGNGGGMGLAFCVAYPLVAAWVPPIRAGLVYGVGIFLCLLATVYLSPSGTTYLFAPDVLSGTMGLAGHVVYGSSLGIGVTWLMGSRSCSAASRRPRAAAFGAGRGAAGRPVSA